MCSPRLQLLYIGDENMQGITTAPILFALQEEPLMQTLISRKFSEEGDSRMVKLNQSLAVYQFHISTPN